MGTSSLGRMLVEGRGSKPTRAERGEGFQELHSTIAGLPQNESPEKIASVSNEHIPQADVIRIAPTKQLGIGAQCQQQQLLLQQSGILQQKNYSTLTQWLPLTSKGIQRPYQRPPMMTCKLRTHQPNVIERKSSSLTRARKEVQLKPSNALDREVQSILSPEGRCRRHSERA